MNLLDLVPVAAIFTPLAGAGLAVVVGHFAPRLLAGFAVAIAGITAALGALTFAAIRADPVRVFPWIPALGISFDLRVDGLGALVAAVAGSIGFLVVLYSVGYMRHAEREGYSLTRYYALVLLFIGAMVGLALAESLLAFYVFWETVGLCSFALISYYHRDPNARRAGLKAFAVTRVGDIGLLIGVVALWSASGVLGFGGLLAGGVPPGILGIVGVGFLLAAMGKSAQVPLHIWLPDAMEAPTPVSALIHAATMVNAGVYLLARTYPALAGLGWWPLALLGIGSATALIGAASALVEPDVKRVLAFSTSSQLGFMVAAVGAGAITAASFHLLSQAVFKALLFLAAGAVIQAAGTRDLYRMGGLRKAMPLTAAGFLVGTLALVGIPAFNGFWSKEFLLEEVLGNDHRWTFALLVLASLMTAAYAWRAYTLAFEGTRRGTGAAADPPGTMRGPIAILLAGAAVTAFLIPLLSGAMAGTMPAYPVIALDLPELLATVMSIPALLVLAAIAILSATLIWGRGGAEPRPPLERSPFVRLVRSGFLVDAFAKRLATGIARAASVLGRTQTGDLNVNSAAILGAILIVVAVLLLGVLR